MKSIFTFLLLFFLQLNCIGQGQDHYWHFGNGASIHFVGGGAPVALTGSALFAEEGSSSISDATGNLLFYSDGNKVWDNTNTQMPNGFGLGGGTGSCAQACIIIKQPGNANMYYIFTVDQTAGPLGFSYSTVDISLNGGLGDVVIKNTLIYNQSSEKISATYHCNGVDIWISTHDYGSDLYRSVLLSSTGVGASVTSAVGPVLNLAGYTGLGTLKFSPDGTKAAICNYDNNFFDLVDFDNSTGIFSNQRDIYTAATNLYGLEFSPNSNVLYSTETTTRELFQYDVSSGVAATILASRTSVGVGTEGNLGQLQLGPDKKIYMSQTRTAFIGVVSSPNTLGVGCSWTELYLDTDVPGLGNIECRFGLPFTLPIRVQPIVQNKSICQGDSILISGVFQSLAGNYNDTLFGANVFGCDSIIPVVLAVKSVPTNTVSASICQGQNYILPSGTVVSASGIYKDTLNSAAVSGCDSIVTTNLTVGSPINTNGSHAICIGQSYIIHGVNRSSPGIYSQTYTATGGCDSISDITLIVNNPSTYTVSASICPGQNYTLPDGGIVSSSGTYKDTLNGASASGCDSIVTTSLAIIPIINTNAAQAICAGQSYPIHGVNQSAAGIYTQTFTAAGGCDSISAITLTVNNPTTFTVNPISCSSYTVNGQSYSSTGVYSQTLTGSNGCDSTLTINLTVHTPVAVSIENDTTISSGSSVTISSLTLGTVSYSWNTGQTTETIIVSPGITSTYIVMQTDSNGCVSSDTITITIKNRCDEDIFVPNSFSPNSDGQNDVLKLLSGSYMKSVYFVIYDRWGEKVFETNDVTQGWDGNYRGKEVNSDVYVYLIRYSCSNKNEEEIKRGNVSVIR